MSSTLSNSSIEIEKAAKLPEPVSTSNQDINNRLKSVTSDVPVSGYDSLSRGDRILVYLTFATNGIATLLAWNLMVSSSVALQTFIWPGENFFYLLGAFEYAAVFVVSIVVYPFNNLNVSMIYISGAMNVTTMLLYPTVTFLLAGNDNVTTGKWLLVAISVLAGVGTCLFRVVGFAFASIMPFTNAFPLLSGGMGMSGALTFSVWLFFSHVVFPQTLRGAQMLLYTFFAFGTSFIIVHLAAFTALNRRPWFRQIVQKAILSAQEAADFRSMKATKTDQDQTTQCNKSSSSGVGKEYLSETHKLATAASADNQKICSNSNTEADCEKSFPPPRHILPIAYDCSTYLFCACITAIITMLVYPTTGPLNWPANYTIKTIIVGTFQITNMCMRYSPSYSFFRIRRHWLLPVVIARSLFVPLFLTPARFARGNAFFTHPATLIILMVVFSMVHGWTYTLAGMYTTACLENPKEKAIATKILVIVYAASTVIGLLLSKLFLLGQK